MTTVEVLSWVCSGSALVSLGLTYSKSPRLTVIGPVVGMLAQPVWALLGYVSGGYGLILTSVVFFFIHVKGYRKFKNVPR